MKRLEDVRKLVSEFQHTHDHLHLLVNNAGCAYPRCTLTPDGLEATLALNYLAPFLLTELLLETLKASAPARIINVSSAQHAHASIEFDNLLGEKKYGALRNNNNETIVQSRIVRFLAASPAIA